MALQAFTLLLLLLLLTVPFPSLSLHRPQLVLLDQITINSTFNSPPNHHKTAVVYKTLLPSNLSNYLTADFIRFRSGSLHRHGATLKEFTFPRGIIIHPHVKRIIVVRQNLLNLTSSTLYNIPSNFKLVSPILGLLIYPTALSISFRKKPVAIDFSEVFEAGGCDPGLCASFGVDGSVRVANETRRHVCYAWGQGHYGVVVEEGMKGRGSWWKVVVLGVVGGGFGVVMVGMVVVAVASKRKRKVEEQERRRVYEEEAMRVSMVGHVRAPVAGVVRTAPAIENNYGFQL